MTLPLKVTFIGRVDPRKGIEEVVRLFERLTLDKNFECAVYGVVIPNDMEALTIAQRLRTHPNLHYIEVERKLWTPATDEQVLKLLRETDVFVQPYRTLESTVDTPLLLLEAMAALCVVLSRPVGDIKEIYGESPFIIYGDSFVDSAMEVLEHLASAKGMSTLMQERERLYQHVRSLGCSVTDVTARFLEGLGVDRECSYEGW
jgi:glycosyltransferase involved in cell wall biosynthesis